MGKLPWAKFFYADFIQDTRILSNQAVGGWIRILCQMWHENTGTLIRTKKQLSRLLGTDENKAMEILKEIVENKVANANITEANKNITVTSRRIAREVKDREGNRQRQEKFQDKKRDNGKITVQKSEAKKSEAKKSDLKDIKPCEREDIFNNEFWPVYPPYKGARPGKEQALDIFLKITEKKIPLVLRGVRYYAIFCRETGTWPEHAKTWLRNEGWTSWQMPHQPEPKKETPIARRLRESREEK